MPGQQISSNSPEQLRTPVSQPSLLPQETQTSPIQTSPPKTTPAKPVLKALPTVRDHTTDVLTPEGDEYVPREHDDAGELKVSAYGEARGGRDFKMRTFHVPNRGEKRFMLATECARVLNYRDSYLLFNKNRSLYKIIATQAEKDELIHQEILPYSYRSRQIAIVTARSMFRQFGARVIVDGRRVKDDYWESKARKQGFTEEDMAGEKRPGGTKAREAVEAPQVVPPEGLVGPTVVYSQLPMTEPPTSGQHMPLPSGSQPRITDRIDFTGVPSRRHEITGPPYVDHTQRSAPADLMHQAQNAAENNKMINQQREQRGKIYTDSWNRVHDSPVREKMETSPSMSQQQPAHLSNNTMMSASPTNLPLYSPQGSHMISPLYNRSTSVTHAPSPLRQPMPSLSEALHQNRSTYNAIPTASQNSPYGYPSQQGQAWGQPPPQPQLHPQQSPISPHHPSLPHYSPSIHPPQPSLQHHPSQSPHGAPPPQLHHAQNTGPMQSHMSYPNMGGLPRGNPAGVYGGMGPGRSMYNPAGQGSPTPSQQQQQPQSQQQHDYVNQITAAQQGAMQGYAAPAGGQAGQQGGWGGYPVTSGY